MTLTVTVNGTRHEVEVEARLTVADLLRDRLGLTGTHLGCEHGVCGACTILLDGSTVRSCLLYAPQVDGCEIRTIEDVAGEEELHPIQEAMRRHHGLQCGFCTPGFVLTILELLSERRGPDEAEIREALSGNLCRCTGYETIVDAVLAADATWERSVP
jgi:carbon-monoxide dehydrogenase small subunit